MVKINKFNAPFMMQALAKGIDENLEDGMGFALFIYPHNDVKIPTQYVSNSNRQDMIEAIEAWLDRQEHK